MLLSLALLGHAATPDADLGAELARFATEARCTVVVAAAGDEAKAAAERAIRERGVAGAIVTRVSPLGDPKQETVRAIAAHGASCGVRVAAAPGGGWDVQPHGTCVAGSGPPVAAPVAAAPVAVSPTSAPAPVVVYVPPATAAAASADWAGSLVKELGALPTHAARRARLTAALGEAADADRAARLGNALATVGALERTKRTDASIVRMFLSAALSGDPSVRAAALAAANAGGDPPVAGVAPVAVPAPVAAPSAPVAVPAPIAAPSAPFAGPVAASTDAAVAAAPRLPASPEKIRQYKARRLVRGDLTSTVGGFSSYKGTGSGYVATIHTWAVRDGGGAPYPTPAFARAVGDGRTLARLDREKKTGTSLAVGFGVGTAALGIASVAAFSSVPAEPTWDAYEDYDDYSAAQDRVGPLQDYWRAVGMVTLTGAICTGTVAVLAPLYVNQKQQWVNRYYTPSEADALIEKHNARVREELGLSEEDVLDVDVSSWRLPAEDERPALAVTVQPWVAPNGVGIRGTF